MKGIICFLMLTIAVLGVVYFYPDYLPIVSESDTLPRPVGTVVIYYMDGTMNAGAEYFKPRAEGTWIVFESEETIRVVPVFNVLEVYWFAKDSIELDPYHQQFPIPEIFEFPPTQK